MHYHLVRVYIHYTFCLDGIALGPLVAGRIRMIFRYFPGLLSPLCPLLSHKRFYELSFHRHLIYCLQVAYQRFKIFLTFCGHLFLRQFFRWYLRQLSRQLRRSVHLCHLEALKLQPCHRFLDLSCLKVFRSKYHKRFMEIAQHYLAVCGIKYKVSLLLYSFGLTA